MFTRNISMSVCNIIMLTKNIIKLHVDINTFQHVGKSVIVLLQKDIIYLAYRRQTCTNIGIQNF